MSKQTRRHCGTMNLHFHAANTEPGYANTRRDLELRIARSRMAEMSEVIRIPVVVHDVHGPGVPPLSAARIQEQIERLNLDFRARNPDLEQVPEAFRPFIADTKIEFALASSGPDGRPSSGITRHQTSVQSFPQGYVGPDPLPYIDAQLKQGPNGVAAWPADSYLNIWVCELDDGLLGYAAFPGAPAWRDGVVITRSAFGSGEGVDPNYNLGRTAVHELAHWLGLLHIWGDDGGACSMSDNVGDTPNQGGPNYESPTYPNISCGNAPHGDMFMNYMDYVYDAAMVMFTRGQARRMQDTLRVARRSLLDSTGLEPGEKAPLEFHQAIASRAARDPSKLPSVVFDGVSWV